jgi:predicted dienelactone hydrolase
MTHQRARRGLAVAALAASLAMELSAMSVRQSSPSALPRPTGSRAIGTTTWHVADVSRTESFRPPAHREVQVLAWYPIPAMSGRRAPYLRNGLVEAQAFATLLRAPGGFDHVAAFDTNAQLDAFPDDSASTLPALVFSHGYTAAASAYTSLVEDLASHGYIVLSVVHPYEAISAMLADGRSVSMLDESRALRPAIAEVFKEWSSEDQTMAAVTGASDPSVRERMLRDYLEALPKTKAALRRWVDDSKLVLDRLSGMRGGSVAAAVAGRIDMTRIGVLGHSMGGVTAGQFCVEDARCRAGLNLDGIPQYGTMIDRRLARPFLMVYSARPGRLGASDLVYRRAASPYYRVDVQDTLHLDFSDYPFWAGPLRERGAVGKMAPERVAAITRRIVREYFDQELGGRQSPLLAGEPIFPEVTVTVYGRKQ